MAPRGNRRWLVLLILVLVPMTSRANEPDNERVHQLLDKYCTSCHGKTKPKGNLTLTSPGDPDIVGDALLWHRIRDRLRRGEMPPWSRPQPTNSERELLVRFGERVLAKPTLDGHRDPGPLRPRRLNVREHRNMLRDLVLADGRSRSRRRSYEPRKNGTIFDANKVPEHPCDFVTRILPADTRDGGFDTIGENLTISPHLLGKYLRCNKRLFDEFFEVNARRSGSYQARLYRDIQKLKSGPPPRGKTKREALDAFFVEFASRAFRRPVKADELDKYLALFDRSRADGMEFEDAIRLPLEAMLASPRFGILWADSVGRKSKDGPTARELTDYELATRLALFLWSSLPDRDLLQLAEQGKLGDDKILEEQVRRMLCDQRVDDGLLPGFVLQWLQLDLLDRNQPRAEAFPEYFQNNLSVLMQRELTLFADAILVEDRSIVEFVSADWGLLCYPLAHHYGVKNFPGRETTKTAAPSWYRVKYVNGRRGGVLTMGKVLTGTSQPTRTSPVHRGKWILETILGAPPPPPPPEVDNDLKVESAKGERSATVPELMAKHRAAPACYECHRRIDPLGIALENYDAVGRWRDLDQSKPIQSSAEWVDGSKFTGGAGLRGWLLEHEEDFVRCFVERMLTYALGRKLAFYDVPTVEKITKAVRTDENKFSRVVVEVAKSYPFRYRRTRSQRNTP